MGCPRCHHVMPEIGHGQMVIHDCGLMMTRYGNALNCEMTEAPPSVKCSRAPLADLYWELLLEGHLHFAAGKRAASGEYLRAAREVGIAIGETS